MSDKEGLTEISIEEWTKARDRLDKLKEVYSHPKMVMLCVNAQALTVMVVTLMKCQNSF